MTGVWIALGAAAALAAVAGGLWLVLRRAPQRVLPATVSHLADETSIDPDTKSVRSVQRAEVLIDRDALAEIWTPTHLERLARTYWRFLTRVTLGLVRVTYSERGRAIVLLAEPLRLLTFEPPEYEMDATRGLVRWRIARGLLVARRGRDGAGYLQIEVRRVPGDDPARERLDVEVAVVNFYPAIASGLSLRLYNATQSRIHVVITYAFLRSLARLDLAESRVGRFSPG
ncbi:MAG TPA: hypothetical protein VNV44_07160 [Solirubrobacteraceae bacterium]|jgi:hypothetical protein|nr:hypothetical protein [Solirubrobacteraceae bacterium]